MVVWEGAAQKGGSVLVRSLRLRHPWLRLHSLTKSPPLRVELKLPCWRTADRAVWTAASGAPAALEAGGWMFGAPCRLASVLPSFHQRGDALLATLPKGCQKLAQWNQVSAQ